MNESDKNDNNKHVLIRNVHCWEDFDELLWGCGPFLFRGQRDSSWNLETNYEREFGDNCSMESFMINRCISEGHLFVENPPDSDDVVSWLAEMQHCGASTRLLDVTRSKYIALFFAVKDNEKDKKNKKEKDGAVWIFNTPVSDNCLYESIKAELPRAETDRQGEIFGDGIMPYQDTGWQIAEAAIKCEPAGKITETRESLKNCKEIINEYYKEGMVIHLVPKRLNKRLLAQQGEFLFPLNIKKSFVQNLLGPIGGSGYNGDLCDFGGIKTWNDARKKASPNIIKCIIPASMKKEFEERLLDMNISNLTLFPDEEGFMRSLKYQRGRDYKICTSRHGRDGKIVGSFNMFEMRNLPSS